MIETIGGLLAIQKHEDARRVLSYFQVTQDADGHWPQNMFTNGVHSWNGIQLDETAFVIQLVELALRENALKEDQLASLWPMVRRAAGYLVCNGPLTPLDRWEEESGYFASTMAVEISALLAAADLADRHGEPAMASYLRETADAWNGDHRTTALCHRHRPGPRSRRGRLLRAFRPAESVGSGHAGRRQRDPQEPRAGRRAAIRSPKLSAPMRWPWSASVCVPPTIRGSSTP